MAEGRPPARIVSKAGPSFKIVFATATGLTVLSLVAAFVLVFYGPDTEEARRLADTCNKGFMLGLGAIIGMISGKLL
jgi:hypothetical protein